MSIADRAKKIMAEQLGLNAADIKGENHIVNDLGADSLDEVELVMALEDEFEIDIPDDTAEELRTVDQIVTYIEGRVKA